MLLKNSGQFPLGEQSAIVLDVTPGAHGQLVSSSLTGFVLELPFTENPSMEILTEQAPRDSVEAQIRRFRLGVASRRPNSCPGTLSRNECFHKWRLAMPDEWVARRHACCYRRVRQFDGSHPVLLPATHHRKKFLQCLTWLARANISSAVRWQDSPL